MEQPKRPQTAYWLYLEEHRADIVKELGTAKGPAVAKAAGEKWKNLAEAAKKPFEERAAALKIEHDKAVEAFKAQGGVMARKRKDSEGPATKKDPSAPKRPAGGGYGIYLAEVREEVAKSLPAGHKITDVSKAVGAKWKALTDAERKPYEEKYAAKRQEYEAALAEWKASGGADQEGDADAQEAGEAGAAPKPPAKSGGGAAKGEAPAAKRGRKVATPQGPALEEKVLQRARELGMEDPLRNLAGRREVASLGLPGQKLLDALQKSCGLVNKAKAALLGGGA